jgi:predicted metal-dependent hydrolase
MLHTLFSPNYKLIINPKLKYIHLTISENGELVVKAPSNSKHQIEQLLHKKKEWIEKAQKRFTQKKGRLPTFENSKNELYHLGNPYPLNLTHVASQDSKNIISFEYVPNVGFNIEYNETNIAEFHNQIEQFYRHKAKEIITPLVEKQAQIMSLYPTAISFRKTKRQWGSCSSKNRLSFNTGLIKLPLDVIQYVIIHELTHIRHKHHQKAFWQEVERYSPNYKKLEQQLKEYLT